MIYGKIKGIEKEISKLIIGNDYFNKYSKASRVWDLYYENGGNTFDNAHIYGGGSMEALLGKWHRSRNILSNCTRKKITLCTN